MLPSTGMQVFCNSFHVVAAKEQYQNQEECLRKFSPYVGVRSLTTK